MSYEAALREAVRLLEEHAEKLLRGQCSVEGQFDVGLHSSIGGRVARLQEELGAHMGAEAQRLGTWGPLGQGTGAPLVRRGDTYPQTVQQLIGMKSKSPGMKLTS